jgi:hypothetical protein
MRHQDGKTMRPLWASFLLLAFLLSATPILPVLTALTAWLGGEHDVSVAMDRNGARVVLSHDSADPLKVITHSHCVVSRAITSIAEQAEPFHSDHILTFSGSDTLRNCSSNARLLTPSADVLSAAVWHFSFDACRTEPTYLATPVVGSPSPSLSVTIARATVLLI